jgi:thymidylate synthase
MATLIRCQNMRNDYVDICRQVWEEGVRKSPRGMPTRDLRNVIIQLDNPQDAVPVGIGRVLNLKILALEALQLIGATSTPELLIQVQPRFKDFQDDDGTFWGAYGTRVRSQLHYVFELLDQDRDSRQAVITLWDPRKDSGMRHPDHPCTVALEFSVNDHALDMTVFMRSNDAYLGLAYDIGVFAQVQACMADALRIPEGVYVHHAASLHLYERDAEAIERLYYGPITRNVELPFGLGEWGSWASQEQTARAILAGRMDAANSGCAGWYAGWYVETLRDVL